MIISPEMSYWNKKKFVFSIHSLISHFMIFGYICIYVIIVSPLQGDIYVAMTNEAGQELAADKKTWRQGSFFYFTINSFPLDKMGAFSQTTFSHAFSWMPIVVFDSNFIEDCSYMCNCLNPTLFFVMSWCRTCDKQLSKPMPIQFHDVYMRHEGEIG